MSGEYADGERRDCLNSHGTLKYDTEDDSWEHTTGSDIPRVR
jgi:hypothetical protein